MIYLLDESSFSPGIGIIPDLKVFVFQIGIPDKSMKKGIHKVNAFFKQKNGADDRNRTYNLLITKSLRYVL